MHVLLPRRFVGFLGDLSDLKNNYPAFFYEKYEWIHSKLAFSFGEHLKNKYYNNSSVQQNIV